MKTSAENLKSLVSSPPTVTSTETEDAPWLRSIYTEVGSFNRARLYYRDAKKLLDTRIEVLKKNSGANPAALADLEKELADLDGDYGIQLQEYETIIDKIKSFIPKN